MNFRRLAIIFLLIQLSSFVNAQHQSINNYKKLIFAGDYPDPSLLRDGDTYYIVHSSFEYYPGLLVWSSKDLVNWTPVANALQKYIGSVWAPDLVKYKNKYYIYFPANNSNYVVTADAITGPWSDPVDLKIGNIDPGHIADTDGKRYLYFSNGGYVPLSGDGLSVTGELKHVYDGWVIPREWSIECFCMEGPKITKRGDYYYLSVAEGGTAGPATSHMIISARSKSCLGPWENSPYNPVARTTSGNEQWCSKGHGTLFEDARGKWWILYHAYEKDHYNMGRQTLVEPVEWTKDGWFKMPGKAQVPRTRHSDFTFKDHFEGSKLNPQWKFFGEYDTGRFHFNNNSLIINAKGNAVAGSSPLLYIPSHHSYTAEVELSVEGDAIGGLILFYNNTAYSGILADKENVLTNLKGWQFPTEKNVINRHVYLRLRNVNNVVDMFYSLDGKKWNKIENSLDVSAFHHNVLGGFLSLRIGLCSVGTGRVAFKNFIYKPVD
ncbi:MAG: family 43 glycosylhydrolase [Ferruginibacter sp.]